jgi:tetratricopeptide (TPR) repeat protein
LILVDLLINFNCKSAVMKTILHSLVLIGLAILFSSSAWVTLTLVQPAQVSLPQHIQTMIIVDRTLVPDTKENKLEGLITGEAFHQDEQAVLQAIEGLIYTVSNGDRFKIIRTTERYKGDPTGKVFPKAMSWTDISILCSKYKADAALILETFDSDFMLTHGSRASGTGIPGISFYAEGIATISMGFRIYDATEKVISDAYLFNHEMHFDAGGNSLADAVAGVLNKTESVKRAAYEAGTMYGQRITPTYYTVTRYFYDKPKKNKKLSEGVRKSKVADWQGAVESWKEAMKTAKKDKHKGRISLNIAVGYEVLGDLDKALEWAQKSYVEYEEKMADDYMSQLKARINEEALVKQQLEVE